jgi:hypothetical protein
MSSYEVKILRNPLVPVYKAQVFCDGEPIPDIPFITGLWGSVTRDGAIAAGKRLAELHRENSGPAEPLELDPA